MEATFTSPTVAAPSVPLRRVLGATGAAAGVAWVALTAWEHAAGLQGGSGTAWALNQAGFAVAMAGFVAMLAGVHAARPAGGGRVARIFTVMLVLAWLVLLAGILVSLTTSVSDNANPGPPLGGLLQLVGLTGVGIGTARARTWTGVRRWWPLGMAVYFVGVVFVPAILGHDPSVLTESLWALGYSGLGVALATEGRRDPAGS